MESSEGCSVIFSHAAMRAEEESTNEKRELYVLVSTLAGFMLISKDTSCSSRTCSRQPETSLGLLFDRVSILLRERSLPGPPYVRVRPTISGLILNKTIGSGVPIPSSGSVRGWEQRDQPHAMDCWLPHDLGWVRFFHPYA